MPKILRLPEAASGQEPALVDEDGPAAVSLAEFLARSPADPAACTEAGRPTGVRLSPADPVEALAPHLSHIARVDIEMPGPGEGRGYTQARLLRQRHQFMGEIRAVGAAVRQDLLFFMVRCGFDAFALAAGENLAEARQALRRFTLAYQPAVPRADIAEPRFTAARG